MRDVEAWFRKRAAAGQPVTNEGQPNIASPPDPELSRALTPHLTRNGVAATSARSRNFVKTSCIF